MKRIYPNFLQTMFGFAALAFVCGLWFCAQIAVFPGTVLMGVALLIFIFQDKTLYHKLVYLMLTGFILLPAAQLTASPEPLPETEHSPNAGTVSIADCNDPLTGKGVVVDEISGTCLLCSNGDLENLTDGDLSNFSTFNAPLTVLVPVSVVSIKDVNVDYTAGERVGFVIEPAGGLFSVSVLGGFQIRTFKDNVLQETVTGSALTVHQQGHLRRLSFVTTLSYDEVELRLVSTLGVLSSVRVYYAYGEPVSGCDYSCINAIVPPAYTSSINDTPTGIFGVCLFCSLTDEDEVVDADTTNSARIHLPIGVGGNGVVAVKANEDIPANYEVGFAVKQGAGLLNLALLGATTISTYDNGMLKESVVANATLANVALLGASDINLISFKTTMVFDEVRIKVSGISLLVDLDVYYAFVRPDDDNDGFTHCVDKCAGSPDYLDEDGDGTPDACDAAICTVNAGLDISVCPTGTDAQLGAAGMGQSWSAVSGNPAGASISASGAVSGMSVEGVYGFVLSEGSCHDTIFINRFESTLDAACNNPITGPKVIITDPGTADCLLCVGANVVIDGVLSGSVALNTATSITGATTLIAVKDTSQVYPAGRRTGFVVQALGGLLNATLLGNLRIRTYLNGTLQETATTAGNVLGAGALTGNSALQRISFVTSLPFNEVELVATATLNLLTGFRVYYAFEEPGTGCPSLDAATCAEALDVSNTTFCGQLSYDRTGLTGLACVGCSLENLGNLLDQNTANFATITQTIGAGAAAQVSVFTRQTIPAGYTAGFVVSGPANLLDAGVLSGLRVRTFLNGVQQEEYLASGGLLQVQVLDASSGLGQLSFVTAQPFDEVQLRIDGLVGALSSVKVYYAYVRRDSDADGSPDCADKCCGGNDLQDTNGNGVPNACDPLPVAVNDAASTNEDNAVNVSVLANDSFGDDGPGLPSLQVVSVPGHGSTALHNNGTPADLTDDYIIYTPAANYNGADVFTYRICDASNDCDTATVSLSINGINDAPVANQDVISTPEDQVITISVLSNDTDLDGNINPASVVLNNAPVHGTALVNPNGTITYTPNANYYGPDTLRYTVCDTGIPVLCDDALVILTVSSVNDLPLAGDDTALLTEDDGATNILVLGNDSFGGDGPGNMAITIAAGPTHGTATVHENGTPGNPGDDYLVYTPAANYHGTDQIMYQICDQNGDCDQALVQITVNSVDDFPLATDDAVSLNEDAGATNISVVLNDNFGGDGAGNSAITIATAPTHGTATVHNNGTPGNPADDYLIYTPNGNFNGTDQISYQICDADGDCDQGTVSLTIISVDDLPAANDDAVTLSQNAGASTISVLANDDFGGDGASGSSISIVSAPAHGTAIIDDNGTPTDPNDDSVLYTPDTDFNGLDQFSYQICDSDGDCDAGIVQLTINGLVTDCNDPLTAKGVVVDAISGDCLLCDNADLENLLDEDLSNYTSFSPPVTVLAPLSVVSIKDVNVEYSPGERVGFVIEPEGGLLSVSVLGGFQIRTFNNNVLQETVSGSSLTVQPQGTLRRISFVTTQPYDEVELRLTSVLGVLSSVRVYYAFGEPAAGCDYSCVNAIVPPAYASTINDPATGIFGICLFCTVNNEDNAVDGDTTNAARIHLPIGVGGSGVVAVKANEDIPAHYEAGFAVRQGSGLLNLTLLGATIISTYNDGVLQESVVADNPLANVALLGASDINLISFKTSAIFDEVRIRVNGISLLVDLDVLYAFVRPDDDNDGFTNCVDKCAGDPDYLDADGDGIPNDCDAAMCTVNAGLDISICPPGASAQLVAAGPSQAWSALPGNPSTATINASGMVDGMDSEGSYGFVLTEGACRDTLYISRFESTLDAACNNPITGPKVIVTDPGNTDCLLCLNGSVVLNGSLSDFISLNIGTSIIGATTLIAVRDISQDYPAGRRTGFVVQAVGGLLNASLLGNFQIRTYLNGSLQETATVSGNVLTAGALTGDGALQRLSFVTTQPFDEVELVATSTLSLLTAFRVYYAFEEPGTGCPSLDAESCAEALNIPSTTYCGQLSYPNTGFSGIACVACAMDNLGNLVDGNTGNFASINLTAGVGAEAEVSVYTRQTIPAGYTAGYIISGPPNLLDASVLGGLWLRTYLNGVQQEAFLASAGVVQAQVIDFSTGLGQLSFVTTEAFDEVQLQVDGLVTVLSTVHVYYAFVRRDTDGDGAPDCADKCCGGDDGLDSNGNGVPNFCDPLPVAVDDVVTTNEDTPVNITVLANDSFGDDGPGNPSLEAVTNPAHGTLMLNNNGTPVDLTDDYFIYTPAPDYFGADNFTYRICDASNDCDTASVTITINSGNDLPVANDDSVNLNEDAPATNIPVVPNDQFGGDGPSTSAITISVPPANGVASVHDNGTPGDPTDDYLVYTPNPNFNGTDQITYQICDADGDCDQATVSITVNALNDPPLVDNEVITTNEDMPVSGDVSDAGDTDPDGTPLTTNPTPVDPPDHGTVSVNPDGTFTYTPDPNYAGPDRVVVQLCDAGTPAPMLCVYDTIFITVVPVNDAPLAVNDNASTPENTSITIPVLNNDSDMDGTLDPSSVVILNQPDHGTATPNAMTGVIEFNPDPNYIGVDTFSYVVCDEGVPTLCDTAVVFISVSATNVRLAVKMRLQGSLYGSPDTLMRDELRSKNRLPALEPYTALSPAFVHVNGGGGELVANTALVFANYGANSIVDWVFIELRDAADIRNVVATRAGLLQRDGDVVDVDGTSLLVFSSSLPASYAVAIRHRNHLGAMTAAPIALSATGTAIDFTALATPLYDDGTNLNGLEQVTIEGKFALWAGNVNTNRSVVFAGQNNDKDPIFNQIDQAPANVFRSQTFVFNGYHLGDVNMAGSAIFAGQNNDVDPIFNNVDSHPKNILKSQTFIIREQLAH